MYVCIQSVGRVCVCVYMYIYIYMYIYVYTHTDTHVYIYIYMYNACGLCVGMRLVVYILIDSETGY